MRILWLDKSQDNPWVEKDGWTYLESSGFEVTKCQFPVEARELLQKNSYDITVIRAEVDGGLRLLEEIKCHSLWSKRTKVIVMSSKWTSADFEEHAKMFVGADKYLNMPQGKVMFVQALREVAGAAVPKPAALPNTDESASRLEEIFAAAEVPAAAPVPPPKSRPAERIAPEDRDTGPVLISTPIFPPLAKDEKDIDLIRKYLHMREEELALVLGEKQELSRENRRLQKELGAHQVRLRELEHSYDEISRKAIQHEKTVSELERSLASEKECREQDNRNQGEKNKYLENQLVTANERYEELKNRVRKDIRKIRLKERDLEAKLEIARRDSETLLHSRDKRVLEFQRKIDALEFDLDQVQDSRIQAESEAERYLAKLSRVARALHLAIGMIEDETLPEEEELPDEPMMGGAALAENAAVGAEVGADLAPESQSASASEPPQSLSDELAALASEGEPTRIGTLIDAEGEAPAEDSNDSQVIEDDSEQAIG